MVDKHMDLTPEEDLGEFKANYRGLDNPPLVEHMCQVMYVCAEEVYSVLQIKTNDHNTCSLKLKFVQPRFSTVISQ